MEVGKQTCEGRLSIDGSFENTMLTRNADMIANEGERV